MPPEQEVILAVDDEPLNVELLRAILEPNHYHVIGAKNGAEALGILGAEPVNLVLLDVMMPGIDGFEVTRRVRSSPKTRSLPLILVTALHEVRERIMGLEAGCDAFITKPYDKGELLARIKTLLRLSRSRLEATPLPRPATDRMNEGQEYAESIINTIREPLISLDQDLRVVSASRSFYEVFKSKPSDTVGQLIYDLGNKQWDIPRLRELLETILPKKATFDNYEVEHDFANIGRRIMLLNARQIQRVLGKERIILLAIEDITERREIENGLEKARKELKELATELRRTARVKSEFLANMSHELRTPLNSINGFSEVLFDETFGPLNGKQKEYVNNVLSSGKHLLLLINQILDMAKVEAKKMTLSLSRVPMRALLSEITNLVAHMVSKKQIHMALEIADDLPDIEADELKTKEIIYNLLSNAIKFTPEGGKIGMRAKKLGDCVEIVVWDSGVGIARENMGKIFEGFFRVDTPYSRVTEGTGLGLPFSRKLVELHGGQLHMESAGLNQGASVRFTLPLTAKAQ